MIKDYDNQKDWYETYRKYDIANDQFEKQCNKCHQKKLCRFFQGGNEDTWNFWICHNCLLLLFKDFGITIHEGEILN